MKIKIQELMAGSGVAFGTSGARGLATAMTDLVCYAYTQAFLQYLEAAGEGTASGGALALAGDFRPSTGRIMEAVARAAESRACQVVDCGRIPSPALALFGLERRIPAIMVTGSHIPDDRNGIKFNKPSGEILKQDEQGIASQVVAFDETLFDDTGCLRQRPPSPRLTAHEAGEAYVARYLDFLPLGALHGLRVGLYQHSAVGRDMLARILSELGADVIPLGRSETFIPVDTEAIRPEDAALARQWAEQLHFDAIVSADGDSDRPLVGDEQGRWLRGDVAGILCARFLEADVVCTPVSCNTAVEKSGWFRQVRRTRIGSPYVISSMLQASAEGASRVVGYEANGGFLLNSPVERAGRKLRPLPTRDAAVVILSLLMLAKARGQPVSALASSLPARFTASDRIKNFAQEESARILAQLTTGSAAGDRQAIEKLFGDAFGRVTSIDRTDGVRITFENTEIIHLRPSGNAPEFRCYSEAATDERARAINAHALQILSGLASARA